MKKLTNLQLSAIANVRYVAKMMSSERFPIIIANEKIEDTDYGDIWLTIDTAGENAREGSQLAYDSKDHWFVNITRRGKTTVHQGPHWMSKGSHGIHASKNGYFS